MRHLIISKRVLVVFGLGAIVALWVEPENTAVARSLLALGLIAMVATAIAERGTRLWSRFLVLGLAAIGALGVYYHGKGLSSPSPRPSFDGNSTGLARTQVVATLEAPIEKGKNAIWCASFQAAWKTLQNDLAKGPVSLERGDGVVEALNRAPSPAPDVPEVSLYAAAGWENRGILQKIRADLQQQFPDKAAPTFPGIVPGSFVAYAYLEASMKFGIPYFQNKKTLIFIDSAGKKASVSSFGIPPEDASAYDSLRKQPRVYLGAEMDPRTIVDGSMRPRECIIDLDRGSKPTQIILAMVEPKRTMAETLALVERRIAAPSLEENPDLGINDVLLVPDVVWRISHHFRELEGRDFQNATLRGQRMDVAQEDIAFRLDRSGAELRAESHMYAASTAMYYVFDRPFLIYLKKRGATRPYFAMWVDNAELLRRM
jgi:hypothetical protein